MKNDAHNDARNRPVSLNNEDTPDAAVFSDAAPSPLLALAPAPAPPQRGSLLQSDDDNEDFEEEEDFNKERDDYAYLYEGESLQDEIEIFCKEQYYSEEEDFDEYITRI